MPAQDIVDPTWFDVVAIQLTRSGAASLEASRELLAHYGDTGHAPSQRALDLLVDSAADTLGALGACLSDTSRALEIAARPAQGRDHAG